MGCFCICKKHEERHQILSDINTLTGITKSKFFSIRCGFNMEFLYPRKSKKINCIFYKILEQQEVDSERIDIVENSDRVDFKLKKVDITKFYKFYHIVLNCLPIFNEDEAENNLQMTSTGEAEENICKICYDRKSDVILHSFCEQCLKDWLPRYATCPMCREEVINNVNNNDRFDLSDRRWSIVEKREVFCKEYLNELDEMFVNAMNLLIS